MTEALCSAHSKRNFFKLAELAKAPLAIKVVQRIDPIFDLERRVNGLPREQRRARRPDKIRPLVADLERWMRDARRKISRYANVMKAIDYMLMRWASFSWFDDDGRICGRAAGSVASQWASTVRVLQVRDGRASLAHQVHATIRT